MPIPIRENGVDLQPTILSDEEWKKKVQDDAVWIVNNATYPWTERQIKLWLIGTLAGTIKRTSLVLASMDQLKEWHRELSK